MNALMSLRGAMGAALAMAAAATAWAEPSPSALRAYERGAFLSAASVSAASGSPEDYAFAARSLLAQCVVDPNADRLALADRAIAAAGAALAADPNSVEARLQLALAFGVRGRMMSDAAALHAGYPQRGRALIDEALALDPNEAWAHALLGGWHVEVMTRGGAGGALLFGANASEAIAAFERARALAPNDMTIAAQYGVALLQLNPRRYARRADRQLAAAAAIVPRDAFEVYVRRQAESIRSRLRAEGPDAARAAAEAAFS